MTQARQLSHTDEEYAYKTFTISIEGPHEKTISKQIGGRARAG